MEGLLILIPIALGLGLLGLIAFLWSVRSGQYEDLEGSAHRVLFDDEQARKKTKGSEDPSVNTSKNQPD